MEAAAPAGSVITLARVVRALHAVEHAASIIPVAIGAIVLFGWWQDVDVFKRIVPGLVAMNPLTAIVFILLGISLALLSHEKTRTPRYRAGEALAFTVALVGVVKCLALIFDWNLPIDQLLFRSKIAASDFGLPNRMAPNTALNCVLTGTALMNIDRRFKRWWPSQFLTAFAAMASLLALLGYAYGVKSFYGIGAYIPMALHTAAAFFIISIGILCARPERGIMAVVSSATSGGVMIRRLLPAVLLLPALLGWIRIAGMRGRWLDPDFGLWLLVVLIMERLRGADRLERAAAVSLRHRSH